MDFDALEAIAAEAEEWYVPVLELDLCPDMCSLPQPTDLAKEVRYAQQFAELRMHSTPMPNEILWLPPNFKRNDESTRKAIVQWINTALSPHKTRVGIQKSIPPKDKQRTKNIRSHYILRCPRGVCQRASTSPPGKRRNTSNRPPAGSIKCAFQLKLSCLTQDHLCPDSSRFYFRTTFGQCFHHNNHSRPLVMNTRARDLPDYVVDLLHRMLLKHCPTSVGQDLIRELTGKMITAAAIRNIKKHVLNTNLYDVDNELTDADKNLNKSTAEQLLQLLENSPDLDYCYLFASRERGARLHTIRRTKRNQTPFTPSLETNAQDDMESLLSGLQIEGGGKVLVAVAWISNTQKRYFRMYPELIGIDCTFKTNAEKRPMFVLVARTTNGKNIPVLNAFFPSEASWVFGWMFEVCLPYLLGPDALQDIRLVTSDQDRQCMDAFYSAAPFYYPNARLRLCKWHKVNRNFRNHASPKTAAEERFVDYVRNWLYSFTSSIESSREENHSYDLFVQFVNQSYTTENPKRKISLALFNYTMDFLTKQFQPSLSKLCFRHFMDQPHGDRADNSFTESENASLKGSVSGPLPFHKLAVACHATATHHENRFESLQLQAERYTLSSQEEYTGDKIDQGVENMLQSTIVPKIRMMAGQEFRKSENYICLPVKDESTPIMQVFYLRSRFTKLHTDQGCPIPLYLRTRRITIEESPMFQGNISVHCSCMFWSRHGFPCRHIYCILGRVPSVEDFHPRHHLKYETYCFKHERYFNESLRQITRLKNQDAFVVKGTFPFRLPQNVLETKMNHQRPLSFFEECYDTIYDCNSGFYGKMPGEQNILALYGLESVENDVVKEGWNANFSEDEDENLSNSFSSKLFLSLQDKVKTTYRYLNTPETRKWYIRYLSDGMAEALRRSKTGKTQSGMSSLPSIDTSKNSKRISPSGSPKRKRKRGVKGIQI